MTVNKYQKISKADYNAIKNKIDVYNKKAYVFAVHGNLNKSGQGTYIDGPQAVYNNYMPQNYNPYQSGWRKGFGTKTPNTIPYNVRIQKEQEDKKLIDDLNPEITTNVITNTSMMNFRNAVKRLFDMITGLADFNKIIDKTNYDKLLDDYTYHVVLAEQLNDIEQTLDDINSALDVNLEKWFDGNACNKTCQVQCQTVCQTTCQGWCSTCHNQHCGSAS